MVDMAQNLVVRDVDLRVLTVLTLAIVASEIASAGVIIAMASIGFMWAFLTTPDTRELVNDIVYTAEESLEPVTHTYLWQVYGRTLAYALFILAVTVLAVI